MKSLSTLEARRAIVLSSVTLLASCSVFSTNGGTLTINTAKLNSYAQVGISGVATILSYAPIAAAIGPANIVLINSAEGILSAAMQALANATNGSVTFSADNTSAMNLAKTVVADLGTLVNDLSTIPESLKGKIGSNDMQNVLLVVNAGKTAFALAQTLIGSISAPLQRPMSQAAMFQAVRLPVPVWAN